MVASPPGKKLQNVLLLSGGEKAMTALALLVGIFQYQPSPFCILDEVDAPLDEANIGRFTELVKEMSVQTQFVLITHSKKTMSIAPVLYGVTMQEPGVSTHPPPTGYRARPWPPPASSPGAHRRGGRLRGHDPRPPGRHRTSSPPMSPPRGSGGSRSSPAMPAPTSAPATPRGVPPPTPPGTAPSTPRPRARQTCADLDRRAALPRRGRPSGPRKLKCNLEHALDDQRTPDKQQPPSCSRPSARWPSAASDPTDAPARLARLARRRPSQALPADRLDRGSASAWRARQTAEHHPAPSPA